MSYSGLCSHSVVTGHKFDFGGTRILCKENYTFKIMILESLLINKLKSSNGCLNYKSNLASIYESYKTVVEQYF